MKSNNSMFFNDLNVNNAIQALHLKFSCNKNGKFVALDCQHMGLFFAAAFINRRFFCRFSEICNKTQEKLCK